MSLMSPFVRLDESVAPIIMRGHATSNWSKSKAKMNLNQTDRARGTDHDGGDGVPE